MTDVKFWHAKDAETIGRALIADCKEFEGLELFDIRFVHRSGTLAGEGCKVLANCRRLPGLPSALTQPGGLAETPDGPRAKPIPVYVIQIAEEVWSYADDARRTALIHHELSHISPVTGKIRVHTAEDFASTAYRYGAWQAGLEQVVRAVQLHDDEHRPEAT